MKRLLPALALLLIPHLAVGQSKLKVDVKIVAITAVVRDKDGRLLPNLTKEDFTLKEDGKPQVIRYFSQDNDLPLHLGLLVDTSGSETDYLSEEQSASETFLKSMLTRPQDEAFLVQFDYNILLKQRMTSDISALHKGLMDMNDAHPSAHMGAGTLLYDAIVGTMQRYTRYMDGRRAIIILSDGDDQGSLRTLDDAVEWAQLTDTTIYTIFYGHDEASLYLSKQPPFFTGTQAPIDTGHGVMQHLAATTGGRFFKVSKKETIEAIYAEIAKELRSQYRIGYTPPPSPPMMFHHIDLRSTQKHVEVQARTGYLSLSK